MNRLNTVNLRIKQVITLTGLRRSLESENLPERKFCQRFLDLKQRIHRRSSWSRIKARKRLNLGRATRSENRVKLEQRSIFSVISRSSSKLNSKKGIPSLDGQLPPF